MVKYGTYYITWGGAFGLLGVALGAFGAHALPQILTSLGTPSDEFPVRIEWFETGVRYHLIHAVALFALGLRFQEPLPRGMRFAANSWIVGITIFSGLLYVMALSGIRVLGALVPIGGIALLMGWGTVVVNGRRWSA